MVRPLVSACVAIALVLGTLGGATVRATSANDNGIHDPSMIRQGRTYYLFGTGGGLQIKRSTDLVRWHYVGTVFNTIPGWVSDAVGPLTDLWAPDISYWGGVYHLYYAGSQFGTNTSVIGLATNATLDPSSKAYRWVDRGLVIRSVQSDEWNAIDPNLAFDASGTPWLAFGSFWSGIKLRRLDAASGKPSARDTTLYPLAARPSNTAIEAPFISYRRPYYYLFVSVDFCCRGAKSTYKIMDGRATAITGPYLGRHAARMDAGGGDVLLAGKGRYRGPGGESIVHDGGRYLLVHHYYDAEDGGTSKVQINPLGWTADGWPIVEPPLAP